MAWSHNLFCSCYRSDTAEGCDSEYQYPVAHIDSQAERSWHSGNLDHIVLSDPQHGLPVLSLLLPGEWVPSRQTRRPPPLAVRIDLSNATDSTSRRRKYLFLPLALSDRFGYIDPTAGHSISPRCTSAPFQHRNTGRETVCCRQINGALIIFRGVNMLSKQLHYIVTATQHSADGQSIDDPPFGDERASRVRK